MACYSSVMIVYESNMALIINDVDDLYYHMVAVRSALYDIANLPVLTLDCKGIDLGHIPIS